MGRIRAMPVAMAALAVGVSSLAVGATSNASLAGGDEWPMFMGGFTHAGTSRAVGPSSTARRVEPHYAGSTYISDFGNSSCCRERWNHLPVAGSDASHAQDAVPSDVSDHAQGPVVVDWNGECTHERSRRGT